MNYKRGKKKHMRQGDKCEWCLSNKVGKWNTPRAKRQLQREARVL